MIFVRYQEMIQPFRKTLKCSSQTRVKDLYQRFVLIGGRKSGKSTLGNLLMGSRDAPLFGTDWYYNSTGKGKMFQLGEVEIDSSWISGDEHKEKNKKSKLFKIQVLDGPANLKPKQYGEFLGKCVSEFEKTTFLITINLNSDNPMSNEDFSKIMDIFKAFSNYSLDLFSNSIIVFTQADEVIENKMKTEETYRILNGILEKDHYLHVKELVKLNDKYFPVNGMDFSQRNRRGTIEWLFEIILDKNRQKSTHHQSYSKEIQVQNSKNMICDGEISGNKDTNSLTKDGTDEKKPVLKSTKLQQSKF